MPKVILISHHYFQEKRKAGFQCLAQAFSDLGWEVVFITSPIGVFSLFTRDYRMEYPVKTEKNRVIQIKPNFYSYVLFNLYTPENVNNYLPFRKMPKIGNLMNLILTIPYFFFGLYISKSLKELIHDTDLVIIESTPALLYYRTVKKACNHAKFIYRVSDDLEFLNCHPYVIEYEEKIAENFDLISVPSEYLFKKFSNNSNVVLHLHGIAKDLFDKKYKKPESFGKFEKNVIFIGNSYMDENFITIAAILFPKWGFHIIGPFSNSWKKDNVLLYGELPFTETIRYLQFADIGLQIRTVKNGFSSLSDSLKVIQYTWVQLPIIAPSGMNSNRKNILYYIPGDENSIKKVLITAAEYDRSSIDRSGILSWKEFAQTLFDEVSN